MEFQGWLQLANNPVELPELVKRLRLGLIIFSRIATKI
jgi:hypothetical protein